MSSIKKTIQINPELFKLGSNKTKKNHEKKPLISKPFISPNILKNKLLNRIKEHKRRETENLEKQKHSSNFTEKHEKEDINKYTDEFNDSIEYLQSLSHKKKLDNEKEMYEKKMLKRKEELQNRTIKNYQSFSPLVNLELPEDLREPLISVNTEQFNIASSNNINSIHLRQAVKDEIPYGVLKGGSKPTYREWNKTLKNYEVNDPNSALVLRQNTSEREKRLNMLKEKIKQKKSLIIHPQINHVSTPIYKPTQNPIISVAAPTLIDTNTSVATVTPMDTDTNTSVATAITDETSDNVEELIMTQNLIQKPKINTEMFNEINQTTIIQPVEPAPKGPTKRIIKKTIKRKYTLGKSRIKKSVAVLLKDRNTRKIILSAQKDLKKKPINDVKQYLREHNLIKIGTNAPNDVIRKIYESAMLTGEVTNNNKDTLLHNFLKEDITV